MNRESGRYYDPIDVTDFKLWLVDYCLEQGTPTYLKAKDVVAFTEWNKTQFGKRMQILRDECQLFDIDKWGGDASPWVVEFTKPPYRDRDWLHEKYVVKNVGTKELARRCSTGERCIVRYANRHGLERRHGDVEQIREMYVEKGMSQRDIASELNCGKGTIARRLDEAGVEQRDYSSSVSMSWDKRRYRAAEAAD